MLKKFICILLVLYIVVINGLCYWVLNDNKFHEIQPQKPLEPIIFIKLEEKDTKEFDIILDNMKRAEHIAESLLGRGGSCYHIMKQFVKLYYGEDFETAKLEEISKEDSMIGDILYYKNNGRGQQHWAIRLTTTDALHGNYNGKTVIASIDLGRGVQPQYYRFKTE